jgi:hypothetical protein
MTLRMEGALASAEDRRSQQTDIIGEHAAFWQLTSLP